MISVILPCRNEEKALAFCLQEIRESISKNNLAAEIIVSDSSSDSSPEIAKREGAILLEHGLEGYGNAYLQAFKIIRGDCIFMADADATYDFSSMPQFIRELENGADLVIGNRFAGKIDDGAMPFLNRHLGTPVLSFILRLFFGAKIKDSQSGIRAIKKDALEKLNLQTGGMEFASEMIVKAIKNGLTIKEIPTNYHKRMGKSKLRPFSDAYKHIRFMLLWSPLFLFFVPGLLLATLGLVSMAWLYFGNPRIFGLKFFYHPMFVSSALVIIGYQLIAFAAFAKTYNINHLKERSATMERLYKFITIERASAIGMSLAVAGSLIYAIIFSKWVSAGFSQLNEIKNSIVALTLIVLGVQTIFSSFMLSILGIKEK